jgi:hypothetical protein
VTLGGLSKRPAAQATASHGAEASASLEVNMMLLLGIRQAVLRRRCRLDAGDRRESIRIYDSEKLVKLHDPEQTPKIRRRAD